MGWFPGNRCFSFFKVIASNIRLVKRFFLTYFHIHAKNVFFTIKTHGLVELKARMTEIKPPNKFTKFYNKSEIIFEENSFGDEMYIIRSGKVKLITKREGQELLIEILGPKEFFGEMALVDSSPRSAKAIAEEDDTQLVVLNQKNFLYLVSQQPPFALYIMQELCQRLRDRWTLYSKILKKTDDKSGLI